MENTLKLFKMDNQPKDNVKVGFTINDVPLWLLLEFKSDTKQRYNDVYWTKLLDIMRKAQAYDYLMAGEFPEHIEKEPEPIKEEPEQEYDEVLTMGGRYRTKKR